MTRVEAFMTELGIDVSGYARTREPAVEIVSADHIYLQGNDGAYVDGQVFISEKANADCLALTLVHELAHDATAKYGLFPTIANSELRDAFEYLADTITEAAAQDPYLPGCLPKRHFSFDRAHLVAHAAPRQPDTDLKFETVPDPEPIKISFPDAPATRVSFATMGLEPYPQIQPYGLALLRSRCRFGTTCIAIPPPL
ncbi:MAG: hypothetical protein K8S25_00045 [Alphaproteobacteria bacterium]|nr:hypothetical protein [Alphaproteobacteria bacterium]